VSYTHGHAESVLRSHRARTAENSAAYLLPHLTASARLLDIGSGPGTITADLAHRAREVVAIEISDDVADLTRAELERQGVTNTDVRVGDVHTLDLEDGSSTSCTPTRSCSTSPTRSRRCGRWPGSRERAE
jgi:16S rRNA A1518/A1519 N6-dimethyltransferase RsmA/KsgA/DIM1 with predicted DNA glycosylase/AP lyase activity